ncbi:MAG: hypothetical protein ACRDU8_04145 [Egibacteraceae bacterium]
MDVRPQAGLVDTADALGYLVGAIDHELPVVVATKPLATGAQQR